MNNNLNLCELLRDVPKGTELYSVLVGRVTLDAVLPNAESDEYAIHCTDANGEQESYLSDGRFYSNKNYSGECCLYPAFDQRDWSLFQTKTKYKEGEWVRHIRDGSVWEIKSLACGGANPVYNVAYKHTVDAKSIEPYRPIEGEWYEKSYDGNIGIGYMGKNGVTKYFMVSSPVTELFIDTKPFAPSPALQRVMDLMGDKATASYKPASGQWKSRLIKAVEEKEGKTYCELTKTWHKIGKGITKPLYQKGDWLRRGESVYHILDVSEVKYTGHNEWVYGVAGHQVKFTEAEFEYYKPNDGDFYVNYKIGLICHYNADRADYYSVTNGDIECVSSFPSSRLINTRPAYAPEKARLIKAVEKQCGKTYVDGKWVEMEVTEVIISSAPAKFGSECTCCGEFVEERTRCGCVARLEKRVKDLESPPKPKLIIATNPKGTGVFWDMIKGLIAVTKIDEDIQSIKERLDKIEDKDSPCTCGWDGKRLSRCICKNCTNKLNQWINETD